MARGAQRLGRQEGDLAVGPFVEINADEELLAAAPAARPTPEFDNATRAFAWSATAAQVKDKYRSPKLPDAAWPRATPCTPTPASSAARAVARCPVPGAEGPQGRGPCFGGPFYALSTHDHALAKAHPELTNGPSLEISFPPTPRRSPVRQPGPVPSAHPEIEMSLDILRLCRAVTDDTAVTGMRTGARASP